VYLVGLPAYLLNTRKVTAPPLSWVDALGFLVWAGGLAVQAVADGQKSKFRQDSRNKEAFITSGLWALSRHPNYLGEIVLHCGLALVAANGLPAGERTLAIVPPFFTAMLLLCVSGVPPLEKHAFQKWGHLPAYQRYVATTGILLPYPSALLGGRGAGADKKRE
jgi:steroid 5-alpha reductase family enzyme